MDILIEPILNIDLNYLVVVALYIGLGGAYLLVFPLLTLWYLNQRWYDATSVERLLMYSAVFFFFPGLLLLSPFINYRPQRPQS